MADPDPYPDSPVCRVEIEHEDGTVRRATGVDARLWGQDLEVARAECANVWGPVGWETWTVEREGGETE